jgi:hypothetical protein
MTMPSATPSDLFPHPAAPVVEPPAKRQQVISSGAVAPLTTSDLRVVAGAAETFLCTK